MTEIEFRGNPTPNDRPNDPILVPDLARLRRAFEGASDDDIHRRVLESTCGATDDSQAVGTYDGTLGVTTAFVNAHQAPVGQVQWNDDLSSIYTNPGNVSGARWGSGTMISVDLFLTAGHLFDQTGGGWERPRQNGTNNIIPPAEIAQNMRVNFNYQVDSNGTLMTEQSFDIAQLVEYRLNGLDFAICRLVGDPGAIFGVTAISSVDAEVGDLLCIIGHPLGLPKRIEAGTTLSIGGDEIRYDDIDTQGGNSGSGILHGQTGNLVGVHTNGGCTSTGGFNHGTRITAVIAASPTLSGSIDAGILAGISPARLDSFAAVVQIVFGVVQDGGGLVLTPGGKPIPIGPWGPLSGRRRDAVAGLVLHELAALVTDERGRSELKVAALDAVGRAVEELKASIGPHSK